MDHDKRSLLRSAGVVGVLTLLSRILGLIRDIMTSNKFGTGPDFSAFELAFRVPNLFRRLFGEGALNAAFIPIFKERVEKGDKQGVEKLLNATTTLLTLVLAAIVVVGYVVSLALRRFFTVTGGPGALVFNLLDIMMPYLLLVCLTGFLSAVQNALEQFAVPALASCLLNICWIAGVISITFFPTLGIYSVAIAVLVSGFLQVWMQVWSVRTKGVRFRFDPDWRAPEIGKMINLMWPVVVGLGVTQINFLVDGFIAWFCVPNIGGNAVLFYGNRLMQFPLGVFGIAIGTAIFPALAKYAARGDRESFLSFMNQGIRSTLFVAVPSAALMIALARPIVELVYQRGQFTLQSTDRTTAVLIYYTAGLWAYCALQVVTRAFYALQDTRTPVKVGAWMVLCNLLLNLTLVWPMWEGGIALATAITATLNLIIMGNILRGRMGRIGASSVLISALRICAVTAAAGAASLLLLKMLPSIETRPNLHWKMARVLIPLAGGSVVFLGVCMAVGLTEWQEFLDAFRKRRQAQTGTASSLEQVKPS